MSRIPVTGELYVQSRSGSSVLDWKDDTTPPGPYLADPDKVRKVVAALDAGNINVTGVSNCVVRWSGPADAVLAVFGLELQMGIPTGAPAGTGPRWHPKKAGGPQIVDLRQVGAWGTLVGGLRVTHLQPQGDARTGGAVGPANPPLPQDLLVGEVADAMQPGGPTFGPARLKAFPAPLETRSQTSNRSRRDAVRRYVPATQVAANPHLVDAEIYDLSHLDLEMVDTWKKLSVIPNVGPDLLKSPHTGLIDVADRSYARLFATTYTKAPAGQWAPIDNLVDTLRDINQALAAQISQSPTAFSQAFCARTAQDWVGDWVRATDGLGDMLSDLPTYVGYLNAALTQLGGPLTTWPAAWAGPALPPSVQAFTAHLQAAATAGQTMGATLADPTFLAAFTPALVDIGELKQMSGWLEWLAKPRKHQTHAALVATGFLAMTSGLLPLGMQANKLANRYVPPSRVGAREVRSVSVSSGLALHYDDFADECLAFRRARFAELQHPGFLTCQSGGNVPEPQQSPYGRWECLLAHHPRVLVVGGAVWNNGQLKASDSTLGFVVTVQPTGGEKAFTVHTPTICATTLSKSGGAVISPKTPGQPGSYEWKELGGSSVATPQVAGVCALAWWIDPEMAAVDVNELVRTHTIDFGPSPGNWYEPMGVDPGSSDASTHPGAMVPDVGKILGEAEKAVRRRLSGPMRAAWWTSKKAR